MSLTITVPKEYGYVLVAVTGTFFLGVWHGMRVNMYRKEARIPYPKPYADSGDMSAASGDKKQAMYLFNCAQRAHGNFLENHYTVAISMLVAGLKYPLLTSGLGLVWMVFRVIYGVGYTRTDKEKGNGRLIGAPFWFAQFGLYLTVGWMGVKMLM